MPRRSSREDFSELGGVGEGIGQIEIRRIEQVENFAAQFQVACFAEFDAFDKGNVGVVKAWTS
ncbi:MAG: hypothetical protein ACR2L1_01035 [Pyrinomonadaceae bacterium]